MRLPSPSTLRDLHVYGGLALVGYGGVQISIPGTCVVLGVALAALGLWLPHTGRTE